MNRILIVDDDAGLRASLCLGLAQRGYRCEPVESAAHALERLGTGLIDLVLLDVTLPTESGWEVLSLLRARGDDTPVLFLTARGSLEDRVHGLRLGADDYVGKPFELEELVARIEAVLRRRRPPVVYELGDARIDLTARRATRAGLDLELSAREFDLLAALLLAEGEVLARAELLRRVWGLAGSSPTNVIDVVVMRLRKKLDRDGSHSVQTVFGEGYRVRARRVKA